MLCSITIRNYALIGELTATFSGGLTIITGETGAGKSIIVGALGLVLGERAGAHAVRDGAQKAIVEAVFHPGSNISLAALLQENDLSDAAELILRREIAPAGGTSRCFVNDTPVTLQLLKQVGEVLVDLHGQHDHQSLLRVESHIALLDNFGGLQKQVSEFQERYANLVDATRRISELRQSQKELLEKKDLLEFQAGEIDRVNPVLDEEAQLEEEHLLLHNAEQRHEAASRTRELLSDGEQSARDLLGMVRTQLEHLAGMDARVKESLEECRSAEAIVSELSTFLRDYSSRIEFSPDRLEAIRARLGELTLLKKKYGGSVEAVIARRANISTELEQLSGIDESLVEMERLRDQQRVECVRRAGKISAARVKVAQKIDAAVVLELAKLGIPQATFRTVVDHGEAEATGDFTVRVGGKELQLTRSGYDKVEFLLSTNPGEQEKPLAKVASGGEISRVMLALKTVLAGSSSVPVLVFDEIDVGVSGRIARAVGMNLRTLSDTHQVIVITHLPQIAGLADAHFVVFKTNDAERTTTSMKLLSPEERVQEVAKLMSGAEVTTAGLRGARELMKIEEAR